MALTVTQIKHAQGIPGKQQKLSDGGGLYLLIHANGNKYWQMAYRFNGKQKTLSLGVYPTVSLADAREGRQLAQKLLQQGVDPNAAKQAQKATGMIEVTTSFEGIAREWFAKFSNAKGWAKSHSDKILARLENDVFPWLGKRPISEIKAPELLSAIRRIESRGALETAHRVLSYCGQIFRYAVATGRAESDPARDLRGALPPVRKDKHFAAITEPQRIGELMRDIDDYQGTFIVKCALKLSPLLMTRPGELRKMKWEEIDFDEAQWEYHVTKTKVTHIVPLARQALEILKELQPLTGHGEYVFPGERDHDRPMSDNAVRSALRRLGWANDEITPHGFRAMASTILDNRGYRPEWIEKQLAHQEPNKIKAAYKREEWRMYLPERTRMMQDWADYLDGLKVGGNVVPLRA